LFVFAGVLAVVFGVLIEVLEGPLVGNFVSSETMVQEELVGRFTWWARICLGSSVALVCAWFLRGKLAALSKPGHGNLQLSWVGFLIAAAIVWLLSLFMLPKADGAWLMYLFTAFNSIGFYWIATALFSPSAFKYNPLGARSVRRRW